MDDDGCGGGVGEGGVFTKDEGRVEDNIIRCDAMGGTRSFLHDLRKHVDANLMVCYWEESMSRICRGWHSFFHT